MNLCNTQAEHRWEYWDCKEGHEWYRCLACGETMSRYTDTGCGL